MRIKVCFLTALLIFAVGLMPAMGQVCGDVTGDTNIDISDMVYLIDYFVLNGPAPVNMADANMDGCTDVNVLDLAYLANYLFNGGPQPCNYSVNCVPSNLGEVYLSHVSGQVGAGEIQIGQSIVFYFNYNNTSTSDLKTLSNGFTVSSPDGASWGAIEMSFSPDYSDGSTFPIMDISTSHGQVCDTASLLGVGFNSQHTLPMSTDIEVAIITLGPFDASDLGKTIIIDSTYYGNGGLWRWTPDGLSSISPAWGGPYVFTIVDEPLTSISLESVSPSIDDPITSETQILAGTTVSFDLKVSNLDIYDVTGMNNGFKIYSPDGAEWGTVVGDTIGIIGREIFDLVFEISYFGVTGTDVDSLRFGGASMNSTGLLAGVENVAYRINIGPISPTYNGKTICLDSVWTPPTGYWAWQTTTSQVKPSWGGPYCYEIVAPEHMIQSSVNNIEYSVVESGSNPAPTKIEISDALGGNLNYTIGTMDAMYQLSSSSGTLPAEFTITPNTNGLPDGTYSDSIEIIVDEALNSPLYIPISVTVAQVNETAIAIDRVSGETYNGQLRTGMPITFTMRFYNKTAYDMSGMSGGFLVSSPDGAEWGSTTIDTTGEIGILDFNLGVFLNDFAATGSVLDTVGFGFIRLNSPGFLAGDIKDVLTVTLEGIDSTDVGKTICIDSSFYPPTAAWMWQTSGNGDYFPEWFGPKCYEIVYSADPPPPPPTGDDSLIIPSVTVSSGSAMIGIQAQLSQPIKGATVPLAIPEGVEIDSISRAGLITESWDYTITDVKPDSGFVFVALINSLGELIPEDTTTLFNIYFHYFNASCLENTYISWDTTLMGNPSRQLTFSDTLATPIYPGFDVARDMVTVLPFVKGDVNDDGIVDIEDAINMIDYMFRGGPLCSNYNAMDINGDCLGPDIADIVMMVDYQFRGGPPPECGCLTAKISAERYISEAIKIFAEQKEHQTILTLSSAIDLKGLELTLDGAGNDLPQTTLEGVNLEYGLFDKNLRIGLFDMDGVQIIKSGQYQIITLDGEYELVSATAADLEFNSIGVMVASKVGELPDNYELAQNYPNPFNPTTEIMLSLPEKTNLTLSIYNIQGRLVTTLAQGEYEAGVHRFSWSAENYASGVYLYKVISDNYTASKKMLLIK